MTNTIKLDEARYWELCGNEEAAEKALKVLGRISTRIENMRADCDGDVYEAITKAIDILSER